MRRSPSRGAVSLSFSMTAVDSTQIPERLQSCVALASSASIANNTALTWRLRISVCFPNWRDALEDITARRTMKSRQLLGCVTNFDVLLNVRLSIFILVINQLDAQNLFYSKSISCLYMFRASCAHRQEVKIVLYSLWYHHTYKWPSGAQVERG